MLRIPGATGANVKCVSHDLPQLGYGLIYNVIEVLIAGNGMAYLKVSRDGQVIDEAPANCFINLEPVK